MADGKSVAYIGVGLMGLPMVKRLAARGWRVRAYDIVPEKIEAARATGAEAAASPADALRGVDFALLNLPTTEAVEKAVLGESGLAAALRAPQLVVDFSTIRVDACRALAARVAERSACRWVDAPVSGGPPAVTEGTLTVMAGGEAADIERLRPLMADIAQRCTHMGTVGAGLAAKMINQLIVGVGHALLAEGVGLAEAAGIDAARIPECLAGGYADSRMLQTYWPRMVARDFAPRGYVRQLLKDLEMVNEWGAGMKVPLPATAQAAALFRMHAHRGNTELDTSSIRMLFDAD